MKPCALGWAAFDTPLGACAVAWSAAGLVYVQLPEATAAATAARLQRRCPTAHRDGAPPADVRRAIDGMRALLTTGRADLRDVPLDDGGISSFQRAVYQRTADVPAGATTTYGALADRLGERTLARAVGRALAANPWALVVPCHRVLAAHGRPGGFSADGGSATKLWLLAIERAAPPPAAAAMQDLFSERGA